MSKVTAPIFAVVKSLTNAKVRPKIINGMLASAYGFKLSSPTICNIRNAATLDEYTRTNAIRLREQKRREAERKALLMQSTATKSLPQKTEVQDETFETNTAIPKSELQQLQDIHELMLEIKRSQSTIRVLLSGLVFKKTARGN